MSANRNHGLDLLRAIAILGVLLLHASMAVREMPSSLQWIFSYGWSGVDLFFVLSGFLIGRQVFEDSTGYSFSQKLKFFWIKRWYRTFPLYFVVLSFYVIGKPKLGYVFKGWDISFLFFFQNYLPPQDFVQSWSLCIEEQFYIIFPLVAYGLLSRQKNKYFWLLPLLVSFVSRYYLWTTGIFAEVNDTIVSPYARFPTHTHLDGISCGVFLAAIYPVWRDKSLAFKRFLGCLGILIVVVCFALTGPQISGSGVVYSYTVLSVGFSLMLIGAYDLTLKPFVTYPIYRLSLWSYSLYLWNNLAMKIPEKFGAGMNWTLQFFIFFAGCLILSSGSYQYIELPFLKLRDRHLKRAKAQN